ncbi:FecR family protein [Variovorax boronicumulans]|uniref:FecR family protein n=1 Tax=Variovorax boronicumulans TaxID=436515 RepID=UPI001C595228
MTEAERIESLAADWLARRDGEVWSDVDQQALDAWIAESIAHRVAWLRLASAWQRGDRLSALHAPAAPAASHADSRAWLPRFSLQRIAAGVLIAVASASWLAWQYGPSLHGDRHYATAVGARQSVALRDGSMLTLNTATQLRASVNESERKVWLDDGEAYFDIAHDKDHPFVVIAGNRRITVLGTRFLVRRQGDQVKLTVEEGRVQVASTQDPKGGEPTVLTRNQSAVASANSLLVMSKSAKQINDELSWRQGRIVFDQTTLGEAATQFNRYNTRKLVIADPAIQGIRIGGSFDVHNMDGFVSLLKQGFGLSAQDVGNETRVSHPS